MVDSLVEFIGLIWLEFVSIGLVVFETWRLVELRVEFKATGSVEVAMESIMVDNAE